MIKIFAILYGPYTLNDPYDRLFNGLYAILIFSKTDRVD